MEWRARVLSDFVAGVEIGLVGVDLAPADRKELLHKRVLDRPVPPDVGSELRFLINDKPEWRVFVPQGNGFLAHSEGGAGNPVTLTAADAAIYTLNRGPFYDVVAAELSCRPEVQEMAPGIWMVGVFAFGTGTRARVLVVENGVRPDDLVRAVKALSFKCIFVLTTGTANGICEGLKTLSEKTIHVGILEASANGFFSNVLKESIDLVTPPPKGAYRTISDDLRDFINHLRKLPPPRGPAGEQVSCSADVWGQERRAYHRPTGQRVVAAHSLRFVQRQRAQRPRPKRADSSQVGVLSGRRQAGQVARRWA